MTATTSKAPARKKGASVAPDDFFRVTQFLNDRVFVEREQDLHAVLLVMLAGGNIHFEGGPGLAKSALVREIAWCIDGVANAGRYFEKQLNADTKEEAVFGGLDVPHYTATGEWKIRTTGYILEALFAFVDEIARGSGWVLDGLLPLWNIGERSGSVNGVPVRAPLLFGASAANSQVDEDASGQFNALVDRITVVRYVNDIRSDANFLEMKRRIWEIRQHKSAGTWDGEREKITVQQLVDAQAEVERVKLSPAYDQATAIIRRQAISGGLNPSPRRWGEADMLAQANAWLAGRDETIEEDAAVMELVLPRDRSQLSDARTLVLPYLGKWANAANDREKEAKPVVADLLKLKPIVDAAAGEDLEEDAMNLASSVCKRLDLVADRTNDDIEKADAEKAQAPELRELAKELVAWQEWARENYLPTQYGRGRR